MDQLPIVRPRTSDGPMGFLNYPPEIASLPHSPQTHFNLQSSIVIGPSAMVQADRHPQMNRIFHKVLVDDSQIFAFLCSVHPQYRIVGLKQAVAAFQSPRHDPLDWIQLEDARFYIDSRGLSAQFLRVCKNICSEASPVLYGNLTIAMRWDVRQVMRSGNCWRTPWQRSLPDGQQYLPETGATSLPDPCIGRFFKRNARYVIAWASFVYPNHAGPLCTTIPGGASNWCDALHWGVTHQMGPADLRKRILSQ